MKKGRPRPGTHAWSIVVSLVRLRGYLEHGYAALRALTAQELVDKPIERDVTVYFLVSGLVQFLAQYDEALELLEEIEPILTGIRAEFASDLALWIRFRDDAAHVIDRSLRESDSHRNDAAVLVTDTGHDATILEYDPHTDTITTGNQATLYLPQSIARAQVIFARVEERIGEENARLTKPLRYRNPAE